MSIDGISGGGSQLFGAAVVSKTMDYMNKTPSQDLAPVDRESFGAAVVSKTFDYMNAKPTNSLNNSYSFQNDVISGYISGKITGQLLNKLA